MDLLIKNGTIVNAKETIWADIAVKDGKIAAIGVDLDVDAKEALKQALIEYKGSILLICHEPEFYRDVVSQVWDCSKWTTKVL